MDNEEQKVLFSCVIPTFGRVALIGELLKSLRNAHLEENSPLEIIIVDNSIPNEAQQIQELCRQHDTVYVEGTSSVREKRNKGVSLAHGDYIFFIDSDCRADVDALVEHYSVLTQPGYDACIGLTNFVGEDSFLWRVIDHSQFMYAFRFASIFKGRMESAPWGPTANMTVKKSAFEKIGGFNTNLPFKLGADDADLGLRLNDNGFKIGMNDHAIVYHCRETWTSLHQIFQRVFRWGRMNYFLFQKLHPERLVVTFPKPLAFWLVFCVFQIALAFYCTPWLLLCLALWPVLYLLFYAIFRKKHGNPEDSNVAVTIGGEALNDLFEIGSFLMSVAHGSIKSLYCEPKNNPKDLWPKKTHSVWSAFIVSVIVGIIDMLCAILK